MSQRIDCTGVRNITLCAGCLQGAARDALHALDTLGLALTNHKHQWTSEERDVYERAVEAMKWQHEITAESKEAVNG